MRDQDKLTAMKEIHSYVLAKLKAPLLETGMQRPENDKLSFLVEIQEQNRKLKRSINELERRLESAQRVIIDLENRLAYSQQNDRLLQD